MDEKPKRIYTWPLFFAVVPIACYVSAAEHVWANGSAFMIVYHFAANIIGIYIIGAIGYGIFLSFDGFQKANIRGRILYSLAYLAGMIFACFILCGMVG